MERLTDVQDLVEQAASRLDAVRRGFTGRGGTITARESHGTALLLQDIITLLDEAKNQCVSYVTDQKDSPLRVAQ